MTDVRPDLEHLRERLRDFTLEQRDELIASAPSIVDRTLQPTEAEMVPAGYVLRVLELQLQAICLLEHVIERTSSRDAASLPGDRTDREAKPMPRKPWYRGPWKQIRLEVLAAANHRCEIKGPKCKGAADQCDHIVSPQGGGSWFDKANLRAACGPCNSGRAKWWFSREDKPLSDTPTPSRDWGV